jgi:hypothetical protein
MTIYCDATPEPAAARRAYLPSSIGISPLGLLVRSPALAENLAKHFDTLVAEKLLLSAW